MSNKLRNILMHAVLVLAFLLLCPKLSAFDPGENDFQTKYQYELYRSWLAKGKFKTYFPAAFTSEKVVKIFIDKNNQSVMAEYDWKDHLITGQRETAGYLFYTEDANRVWSIIKYIEGFIYRLNTQNQLFLIDYVNLDAIEIYYSNLTGKPALEQLLSDFNQQRVYFHPIEIERPENSLIFVLNPIDGKLLKLGFPQDFELIEELDKITKFEEEKSEDMESEEYLSVFMNKTRQKEEKISSDKSSQPEIEISTTESYNNEPGELVSSYELPRKTYEDEPDVQDYADLPKISELDLAEYIQYFIGQKQTRELLNNKISDPLSFLKKEFPGREFTIKDDLYKVSYPPLRDEFHCDLKLKFEIKNDGINILPANDDYYFLGKYMIFSGAEKINLHNLNEEEIGHISPFIPQLVYEHRSLGSKLLNFLLIHDNVPTTLIVQTDERELFELGSYADLLLLLNKFWHKRTVYFSIRDVKKINGFIEFQSYLIAHDEENQISDIAEIQFHLNAEFRIDLIMMVLHPNAEF